jgi:hypothetical protein
LIRPIRLMRHKPYSPYMPYKKSFPVKLGKHKKKQERRRGREY